MSDGPSVVVRLSSRHVDVPRIRVASIILVSSRRQRSWGVMRSQLLRETGPLHDPCRQCHSRTVATLADQRPSRRARGDGHPKRTYRESDAFWYRRSTYVHFCVVLVSLLLPDRADQSFTWFGVKIITRKRPSGRRPRCLICSA